MIAAGHIGANASSRLHRAGGYQRNPFKNHDAAKYSAISISATPESQSQISIGSLSAFVPRSSHSKLSRLLTAAPTAVSASISILHSLPRASAGHRGSVLGR